jgi:hypothetical protein
MLALFYPHYSLALIFHWWFFSLDDIYLDEGGVLKSQIFIVLEFSSLF